jgi:HlyD family secretion protein
MVCGCRADDEAQAEKGGGPPPALVRVAPIVSRAVSPRIVVVGNVTPKWTSIVASGADGIVKDFFVEDGQFVKTGKPFAVLRTVTTDLALAEAKAIEREREQKYQEFKTSRPEEIAEAKAKMLAAQVIMRNAKTRLDRTRQLFAQKATNQTDLDTAEERYAGAEQLHLAVQAVHARVKAGPRKEVQAQAKANYDAQTHHVEFLEAEKRKRTTTAPFDGYVVGIQTFVGQWLSKGDPVVRFAHLDEVDVVANVDQRDLAHVRVGETVDVRIPGTEKKTWSGLVVNIVPRSEWKTGSRGFPVEVRITNEFREVEGQPQPVLHEGMMAEVTFTGEPVTVLLVPKNALVRGTDGAQIHVLDAKGVVSNPVSVQLGLSEGDHIQVIGKGLAAGQQVVTEGGERLRPFSPVRIAPKAEKPGKKSQGKKKPTRG